MWQGEAMNIVSGLTMVVSLLPVLIIEIIGIMLAVLRWRRHPMASMLFLVGAVLRVSVSLAYQVMPQLVGFDGPGRSVLYMGLGLMGAIGLGLLVAAVFVERSVEPKPGLGYGQGP